MPDTYYNNDIAITELSKIRDENPNAFRNVPEPEMIFDEEMQRFNNEYSFERLYNDIINFRRNTTARERIRIFSYAFLLYILLTYPQNNN